MGGTLKHTHPPARHLTYYMNLFVLCAAGGPSGGAGQDEGGSASASGLASRASSNGEEPSAGTSGGHRQMTFEVQREAPLPDTSQTACAHPSACAELACSPGHHSPSNSEPSRVLVQQEALLPTVCLTVDMHVLIARTIFLDCVVTGT